MHAAGITCHSDNSWSRGTSGQAVKSSSCEGEKSQKKPNVTRYATHPTPAGNQCLRTRRRGSCAGMAARKVPRRPRTPENKRTRRSRQCARSACNAASVTGAEPRSTCCSRGQAAASATATGSLARCGVKKKNRIKSKTRTAGPESCGVQGARGAGAGAQTDGASRLACDRAADVSRDEQIASSAVRT